MNQQEVLPVFLQPGDVMALVATARFVDENLVEEACVFIQAAGFTPLVLEGLFERNNQFAGSDENRAQLINHAFADPEVKAILCMRGGYGTVRIIEFLDAELISEKPKWVVGYSDVTVLHSYLGTKNIASLHSIMPVSFGTSSEDSQLNLLKALKGDLKSYKDLQVDCYRLGSATGILKGGNISVLFSLSGSFMHQPQPGTILFIEDLDEYLYHLDRMMMNFKLNGWFEAIDGLIVGGLSDMKDNTIEFGFASDNPFGKTAKEIILEYVDGYDFPVCFDFPAGHTSRNLPLFLNRKVSLEVRKTGVDLVWED
jgi:muramoyltetrapeptide carboxypeptidase